MGLWPLPQTMSLNERLQILQNGTASWQGVRAGEPAALWTTASHARYHCHQKQCAKEGRLRVKKEHNIIKWFGFMARVTRREASSVLPRRLPRALPPAATKKEAEQREAREDHGRR